MGPRSCERGNHFAHPAPPHKPERLQWGRARASAEMLRCLRTTFAVGLLQWGRARASAEMCDRMGGGAPSASRFNGAALVRARKCSAARPSCMWASKLQWGRARASAEIFCCQNAHSTVFRASMGPRSCERGNPLAMVGPGPGESTLQWGRARASAEITEEYGGGLLDVVSFNGAALVRARK